MPQHNESVAKKTDDLNKLGRPKSPAFINPLFDTSSDDSQGVTVDDLEESKEPPASVKESITKQEKKGTDTREQTGLMSKVAKHFNLPGTENGLTFEKTENRKISGLLSSLKTSFKTMTKNNGKMENLKSEGKLLESAQNAIDEIDGVPKKEALMKKLKQKEVREGEADEVLKKLEDLRLIDSLGNVDEEGIQSKIEGNHEAQSTHIDEEISLLDRFKKLTGSLASKKIKGKGKDGKQTSAEEILDNAGEKEDEKEDEKEEKRKKHWWERVFFHNNKKDDKNNTVVNSEKPPEGLKKFIMDLNSGENQFFAYYCFISITIFTITFFAAYNNKEIYDANLDLMKSVKGLYTFGLIVLIIFLLSLSLSFGHDKDIKQKIASFILLNGSIYMGTYYTYLQSNGSLQRLTPNERMISEIIVAFFILFLLASVAYVLFEKRKGKFGRIFGVLYLLTCIAGFFPLGVAATTFNSKLKIPKDQKESLFVPLCTAFFAVGIFLFVSVVIDAIPPLNKGFSNVFNKLFKVLEPTRIKYLIVAGVTMSIFYTYVFYKTYHSKYISGDPSDPTKFPDKKDEGVFKLMRPTYTIGLGLIALIIFSLALTFGGDLKQQLAAIFLTFFVIVCGLYITYLEGENKIKELSKEENTMTVATIAIFMVLLVGCVFLTVFGKKSDKGIVIKDTIKILSNFGSIALFFYMFGIGTAVSFTEFLGDYSGSWPGKTLWAGFGIGLAIIILFIASFFI